MAFICEFEPVECIFKENATWEVLNKTYLQKKVFDIQNVYRFILFFLLFLQFWHSHCSVSVVGFSKKLHFFGVYSSANN